MTSHEIQAVIKHGLNSTYEGPLWEVAYQLAVRNERDAVGLDVLARLEKIEERLVGIHRAATLCPMGWHRFPEFVATKPGELPPDDWKCLTCGYTRLEIDKIRQGGM